MSNKLVFNGNRIHFGSNSLTPYHEMEIAELVRVVDYALIDIDQLTHSYLSSVCRSQYKVIYSNAGMVSILTQESPPHRYHVPLIPSCSTRLYALPFTAARCPPTHPLRINASNALAACKSSMSSETSRRHRIRRRMAVSQSFRSCVA